MKKTCICFLLVTSLALQAVYSMDVQFVPMVGFPLGEDSTSFDLGLGGDTSLSIPLSFATMFSIEPTVGYYFLPVKDDFSTVSVIKGGAGAAFSLPIRSWFSMNVFGSGGYYRVMLNEDPSMGGGYGWFSAGAGVSFRVFESLNLGITGGYRSFLGMYQDMYASANISLRLRGKAPPAAIAASEPAVQPAGQLGIVEVKLDKVFPVLYTWYDESPVGTVIIENTGTEPLLGLRVSLFVESFMDNPTPSPSPEQLLPGEKIEVPVFALFSNKMMEISEGTKASYKLAVEYETAGEKATEEQIGTLSMYDRNSMNWDDDRKAAIFVTAKDQSVLSFAKNVISMAKANTAIDDNLRSAMILHEALRLYGMNYIVDPASSYTNTSKSESTVDYLQFPRQTLEFKSGDCDDLSILFCALLESVNIETAFITIPGHIFVAFALKGNAEEARKKYLRADDFIFLNDKAWVPIEITMTHDSFLDAWKEGTKEWTENAVREQAALFPVRAAWATYKPVGFPGSINIELPTAEKITAAYSTEMVRFINREIAPRVARYQADIVASKESPKALNKLGVLYAQYGLYDEAVVQFERAISTQEYMPTFLNLGNLDFYRKEMKKALQWYSRAVAIAPENPMAVLAMSKVNYEMENYGEAKKFYETLVRIGPDLARQFNYLDFRGDETSRAADIAQLKSILLWEE